MDKFQFRGNFDRGQSYPHILFEKVFVDQTAHLDGGKLLIFDGHNSHLTKAVVNVAVSNNIELYELCLPAHTSSVLQPLDVGVFFTRRMADGEIDVKCMKKHV